MNTLFGSAAPARRRPARQSSRTDSVPELYNIFHSSRKIPGGGRRLKHTEFRLRPNVLSRPGPASVLPSKFAPTKFAFIVLSPVQAALAGNALFPILYNIFHSVFRISAACFHRGGRHHRLDSSP